MKHFGRSILNPTLAILATLAAGAASAEPATPAPSGFRDYDSNGDGMVSPEEFRAKGGDEQAFLKADTNHDNKLSSEEFAKAGGA